jgi:hypothetical protein
MGKVRMSMSSRSAQIANTFIGPSPPGRVDHVHRLSIALASSLRRKAESSGFLQGWESPVSQAHRKAAFQQLS